jgi:hypothetical protein
MKDQQQVRCSHETSRWSNLLPAYLKTKCFRVIVITLTPIQFFSQRAYL